ncbi:hypothetical protein NDA14_004255 [Ustilago hordei]|nr:hypothetical protein NDA10_000129 [Ustilago hordei]KAJ1599542.1 hypothetical protein NDA14_004255 [Ustilago hordei]
MQPLTLEWMVQAAPHDQHDGLKPQQQAREATLPNGSSAGAYQSDINYEKYTSPTRPRYIKPRVDLYNRPRMDPYGLDQEDDASVTGDLSQSKPITTPFPKFNPRDIEIFILEAEAWFKFNQVYEQAVMGLDAQEAGGSLVHMEGAQVSKI